LFGFAGISVGAAFARGDTAIDRAAAAAAADSMNVLRFII
jgi:hypothetical protein